MGAEAETEPSRDKIEKDVTNEVCWAAIQMYVDDARERKFECDHGSGVVTTEFVPKLLGKLCGPHFKATVQTSDGRTINLSFIFPQQKLLDASKQEPRSSKWHMVTPGDTLRDLPAEMFA